MIIRIKEVVLMVYVPDSVSLLSGKNALILFFGVYLTVIII